MSQLRVASSLSRKHPSESLFLDQDKEENRNFLHPSMADLQRSIPSMVDGFKPCQRKILFCSFKRNFVKEAKVAQFSGYVSEHSAYHHDETSLAGTIIGMAQDFVGSNNINLLQPNGQFGTRHQGGKDHANARRIYTRLSSLTRFLFPKDDDNLLDYQNEDGQSIEPVWYMPIIPMVLVNGSEGIGTGWSSYVPNYNPRDIIANVKRLLNDEPMKPMDPWYKGFKGNIVKTGVTYTITGIIEQVDGTTLRVTELPIGRWTQDYKEFLESLMTGNDKIKEPFIKDYKEHNDDMTIRFDITLSEENMKIALQEGLEKKFKLTTNISTTNMHLFDSKGIIKKYDTPEQILEDFFEMRLSYYAKRKRILLDNLELDLFKLDNKVRFIQGVVTGEITVSNRKRVDLLFELKQKGFTPFNKKTKGMVGGSTGEDAGDDVMSSATVQGGRVIRASDYEYLLSMSIGTLTLEKVNELCAERDKLESQVDSLRNASPKSLWCRDLEALENELEEQDKKDVEAEVARKAARANGVAVKSARKPRKNHSAFKNGAFSLKPKGTGGTATQKKGTAAKKLKVVVESQNEEQFTDHHDMDIDKEKTKTAPKKRAAFFEFSLSDDEGKENETSVEISLQQPQEKKRRGQTTEPPAGATKNEPACQKSSETFAELSFSHNEENENEAPVEEEKKRRGRKPSVEATKPKVPAGGRKRGPVSQKSVSDILNPSEALSEFSFSNDEEKANEVPVEEEKRRGGRKPSVEAAKPKVTAGGRKSGTIIQKPVSGILNPTEIFSEFSFWNDEEKEKEAPVEEEEKKRRGGRKPSVEAVKSKVPAGSRKSGPTSQKPVSGILNPSKALSEFTISGDDGNENEAPVEEKKRGGRKPSAEVPADGRKSGPPSQELVSNIPNPSEVLSGFTISGDEGNKNEAPVEEKKRGGRKPSAKATKPKVPAGGRKSGPTSQELLSNIPNPSVALSEFTISEEEGNENKAPVEEKKRGGRKPSAEAIKPKAPAGGRKSGPTNQKPSDIPNPSETMSEFTFLDDEGKADKAPVEEEKKTRARKPSGGMTKPKVPAGGRKSGPTSQKPVSDIPNQSETLSEFTFLDEGKEDEAPVEEEKKTIGRKPKAPAGGRKRGPASQKSVSDTSNPHEPKRKVRRTKTNTSDDSDEKVNLVVAAPPPPRERLRRGAAAKKIAVYVESDNDDISNDRF